MKTSARLAVALVSIVAVGGCTVGTIGTTHPTPPPSGDPATQTETFSGTLSSNGSDIHTFTIVHVGEITATLTSIVPVSPLGFVLGSFDGTTCRARAENDHAGPGQLLSGTPVSLGTFCVRVFDAGNIAAGATVDYTVTVAHP